MYQIPFFIPIFINPADQKVGETGEVGQPLEVNSEQDIFELIGMEYKKPEDRSL